MCLFPVRATRQEFGRPKPDPEGDMHLPCGKCFECKNLRASDWALRASHEIASHNHSCFITLTYDDEHLPSHLVVKEYFQKFMKSIRQICPNKLKLMVSHEYGGKSGRPHHHAIIFGYLPSDQKFLQKAPSGASLFTSSEISKYWKHGYHSIGEANEKTAYYIASYALKSSNHSVTDPATGEIINVTDSMDASKATAIGFEFFIKNYKNIINSGKRLPRYYQKLLETAPERLEKMKLKNKKIPKNFEDFALHSEEYLQLYQDRLIENIKQRSSNQLHAKYVINRSKESMTTETYRSAPDDRCKHKNLEYYLRSNKDDYFAGRQL
jgi:hypothetical protein